MAPRGNGSNAARGGRKSQKTANTRSNSQKRPRADSEESSNKKMRPCPEFYRKRLVDPRNNSEIPMENDPYSGVVLEYEEEEAATMQEAYDKRWGKDCKPTHEEREESAEERLRAEFWGNENSPPRCFTCRKHQLSLPEPPPNPCNFPIGREYLPCGCEYEAAMIEMFLVKKGVFDAPSTQNKTGRYGFPLGAGKHRQVLVAFFEVLFGEFSMDKLLNIGGARDEAYKEVSKIESKRPDGALKPTFILESEASRLKKRAEKEKASKQKARSKAAGKKAK